MAFMIRISRAYPQRLEGDDIVIQILGDKCTLATKYGYIVCTKQRLQQKVKQYAKVNDHNEPYPYFYGIFPYVINSKCTIYLKNPKPNSCGKHDPRLVPKGMPFQKEKVIETGYLTIYENRIILPYDIPYTLTNLESVVYTHESGINRNHI